MNENYELTSQINTTTTDLNCETCYDTAEIDNSGRVIPCPDCYRPMVTIRLTGLGGAVAHAAASLSSCVSWTATTATLVGGSEASILSEARRWEAHMIAQAKQRGLNGRNNVSSSAIALRKQIQRWINA